LAKKKSRFLMIGPASVTPNTLRKSFGAVLDSPLLNWDSFRNGSLALKMVLRLYS
jgi:hypothetical protein